MAGLQYQDDWDSEEFQTALKVVLKCEIQSLLERLSETGEETVLLTASTADLTVGHLASANALKFVDTADVGLIKNKFLCYLAAAEIQADVSIQLQNASRVGTQVQGPMKAIKYGVAATTSQNLTHLKGVDNKGLKPGSDINITTTTTGQPVKRGVDSELPDKFVSAECKRRRVMVPTPDSKGGSSSQPNILPLLSPPVLSPPSSKCTTTTTTHIALSDDDSSSHSTQSNQRSKNEAAKVQPDVKLKTTKVSSKSGGFTEERLSETEFMKFVKQYKSDVQEMKDDNEEQSQNKHVLEGSKHVSECSKHVLEGNKRLQHPQNMSQVTNQQQTKQLQQKSVSSGVTGIIPTTPNKTLIVSSGDKSVVSSQMAIPILGQTGKPDTGCINKTSTIKSDSPLKTDIFKAGIVSKESDKENKGLRELGKPMEVKTDDKLKQQVLSSAKVDSAHTTAKPSSENEKKSLLVTGQKQETSVIAAGKSGVSDSLDNVDEIDTETLISITKAKHLQKMTEADKLIQEKIGKLSNLNWVVEYPKEVKGQRPQQVIQSASVPLYQGVMAGTFDDEEDDEDMDGEEFDEVEFDENDLDEEDRAKLLKMRANILASANPEHFPVDGGMGADMAVRALMAGEFEGDNYEDEEEYDEYGDEDIAMQNTGNMHDAGMALQRHPIIFNATNAYYDVVDNMIPHAYQRSSSPTQDSFLMLNTTLGKCLVCSKIVRRSEMKQHNLIHVEDEDDYDFDDGEEEFDEIDESENIGGAHNNVQGYDETEGEHFEDHLTETCEDKKVLDQGAHEPEFTAEMFVAAKIPLETGELDRSTVCDICNKKFKSHANMIRHQKVHTDLKIHCPVGGCSKNFRITNYLVKHLKKMHPEYKGPISGEQEEGFKCGVCGKVLSDEDTLAEHLEIHT